MSFALSWSFRYIRLARSERELQYHHAARLGKRSEPSGPKMYSLYSQPPQDKLQRRAHQLLQSCLAHLIPCPHTPHSSPHTPHPCLPTNPMTQHLLPRTAASNPSPPTATNDPPPQTVSVTARNFSVTARYFSVTARYFSVTARYFSVTAVRVRYILEGRGRGFAAR
jgi:hypothetical protein